MLDGRGAAQCLEGHGDRQRRAPAQLSCRLPCGRIGMPGQPPEDLHRVIAGVALREPAGRQRRVRRGGSAGDLVRQPQPHGVRGIDRGAGERKVRADLPGHPREQRGHQHVGEQADLRLRHGEPAGRVHNALRAMCAQPEPAAHGDAGHHCPVRLAEAGDREVHPVLGLEEVAHVAAGERQFAQGADVRPRAQAPFAGPGQFDGGHGIVGREHLEGLGDGVHHRYGQGVDLTRTVQLDPANPRICPGKDVRSTHACFPWLACRWALRSCACR